MYSIRRYALPAAGILLVMASLAGCSPINNSYVTYQDKHLELISLCPSGVHGEVLLRGEKLSGDWIDITTVDVAPPLSSAPLPDVKAGEFRELAVVFGEIHEVGIAVPLPAEEGMAYSPDGADRISSRLERRSDYHWP